MKTINKRILSAFMVGIMIIQLIFPVFQSSVYAQEILENESNSLTIENQEASGNLSNGLEELEDEVSYPKDEIESLEEDEILPVDKSIDLYESPPTNESEGLIDNSAQDPRDAETYRESIRIKQNLISNFELTIYDKDSNPTVINDNDVLEIDPSEINAAQIKYDLKIPKNVDVKDGDTYEIDLPDFFEGDIKNQPITFNGVQVASYDIVGKKVIITFNDQANNYDDVEIDVNISGTFDTSIFEEEEEVILEVPYSNDNSFTVTLRPKKEDYEGEDKKSAGFPYVLNEAGEKIKTDRNPSHIDWTVRANDNMGSFDKASIVDDLPEGLKIVEGSFKIERIIRNYKNEEVGREEVNISPILTDSGFELELGEIKDAYEITYTTTVDRPEGGGTHTFNNKANIILDDDSNYVEDSFEGTWSGDLPTIEKEGSLSNDPQIIDWNIKYNYGKEDLGKVSLTDTLSKGEVLPDTIKIYEVDPDEEGNIGSLGTPMEGSFKFPISLDADGKSYLIKFSSIVPAGLNKQIYNTAEDGKGNSDKASVNVDTISKSEKTGVKKVDKEGRPYIEWTLKMNTNKIDVGSIEVSDAFNPEYLVFNVNDKSLYELKKDGKVSEHFKLESYEEGENKGFKLEIDKAGPHSYEFVYRTYYTDAGMKVSQLENKAKFVYKDAKGEGIGESVEVNHTQGKPKVGISKKGEYIKQPSNKDNPQIIKWTIEFNENKILLENPTLSDVFESKNYEYIEGSLKVSANGAEFTEYELTKDFDNEGFNLKINSNSNATFKIEYETTVDNEKNLDHKNKVTLNWQNGEETSEASLGKRDPGVWKDAEVLINEDGSKSIKWKVTFNDNHNVIKNFELSDRRSPAGMEITSFKISRDSLGGNESSPVILEKGKDYSYTESNDEFIVKIDTLNPVTYYLEYTTKLLPEHEKDTAENNVVIKYTGGSQSAEAVVNPPELKVEKRATALEKNKGKEANPVISWEINANTDGGNKYVNLVDAELTDTIPSDQKLIADSIKVERVGDEEFIFSIDNISSTDNNFTIKLPDGPYQYKVTFDTEILEFPSVNEKIDRYTNSTTLENQTKNKDLRTSDSADAYQDYFHEGGNNAPSKIGSQNPDTENIDWTVKLNSEGLRIHNFEAIDQLSDKHSYIKDSFVLKDASGKELKADEYILTFDDENRSFTLTIGDGTIDQAYSLSYSTRLNEELIGNISVSNKIKILGGTEKREIYTHEEKTTAQQWFFGGGGKGRTLQFELRKKSPNGTPLENVKFSLQRLDINGKTVNVDAKIVTNKDGIFITGEDLRAGRYILVEDEKSTPKGYETLDGPIHFIASYARPNEEGKYKITLTDSNWNVAEVNNASATGNVLTIINEYKPIEVEFEASKKLNGQELKEGQFEFNLLDSNGNIISSSQNDSNGKVSFDKQLFKETGTFNYKIKEVDNGLPGVKYDDKVFNIQVIVSEGEKGLTSELKYLDGPADFENIYSANPVKINLEAKKELVGQELKADQFEFELIDSNGKVVQKVSNDENGKVAFEDIEFSNTGDYKYKIREVKGSQGGVDYDSREYEINVTVTDDGKGQLHSTINYPEGEIPLFTNNYSAQPAEIILQGKKVLNGRELIADEFKFKLIGENDGVNEIVSNDSDGNIVFSKIEYKEVGEYNYTIEEINGDLGGVVYDDATQKVKVEVVDDGNGKLVAEAVYENNQAVFNNFYNAKEVEAKIIGEKILKGQSLSKDQFTFELYNEEGHRIQTVKNNAEGLVEFDAINYDKAGEYKYTVREVKDNQGGITYSDAEFTVNVSVIDNKEGALEASINYPDGPIVFTNIYKPASASVVLEAKKILEGQALRNDHFTFELLDENNEVIQTAKNNANGQIIFDEITYDKTGEYKYSIREVKGNLGGVSYDDSEYGAIVKVTDDGNGKLIAEEVYTDGPAVFTNKYTASPGSVVIEAEKILHGQELVNGQFSFELLDENNEVIQTVENNSNGQIIFDEIKYDSEGRYTYLIREVKGSQGGVSYDTSVFTLVVDVVDNGKGELVVESKYIGGLPVFENTYQASEDSVVFEGEKILQGQTLRDGQFTFELVDENGQVIQTAENNANGQIIFDEITYDKAGEYKYTVREVKGNQGGVTYSDAEFTVNVSVIDNKEGALEASISYPDGPIVFTNIYKPASASVVLEAKKILEGQALRNDHFTFELLDENNEVIQTAKNNANGQIIFDEITYDKTGEYKYSIREVKGNLGGVSYDDSEYGVIVKVTDDGDGKLIAKEIYTDGPAVFTNKYTASPGSIVIEAEKILHGQELVNGQFSFELLDENNEVIQTVENNSNGQIIFDEITYDNVGKYTYTIREVEGSQGGVTYDNSKHTVVVKVKDNGKGNLLAEAKYVGGPIVFENIYKASPDSVVFEGKKILKGQELKDSQFTFELLDENNKVIQTIKNNSNGQIIFDEITYEKAGEYKYSVREVNDNQTGVTYDDKEFGIVVYVTDNGKGNLSSKIEYPNGNIEFNNTYKAPPITQNKPSKPEDFKSNGKFIKGIPSTGVPRILFGYNLFFLILIGFIALTDIRFKKH